MVISFLVGVVASIAAGIAFFIFGDRMALYLSKGTSINHEIRSFSDTDI